MSDFKTMNKYHVLRQLEEVRELEAELLETLRLIKRLRNAQEELDFIQNHPYTKLQALTPITFWLLPERLRDADRWRRSCEIAASIKPERYKRIARHPKVEVNASGGLLTTPKMAMLAQDVAMGSCSRDWWGDYEWRMSTGFTGNAE